MKFLNTIESKIPTGNIPVAVDSTTVNTNFNAAMLGGKEASEFIARAGSEEEVGGIDVGEFIVRAGSEEEVGGIDVGEFIAKAGLGIGINVENFQWPEI